MFCHKTLYLPPASEGWGKVIVSVCVSVHTWGWVPQPADGGYPHLRSGWGGGYPIPGLDGGGYPISHPAYGGYPIPGLDGGGYPLPRSGQGVPHPAYWGVPHLGRGSPRSWKGEGVPTWEGSTPPPGGTPHHSMYVLHGGQCASCIHAGELSCYCPCTEYDGRLFSLCSSFVGVPQPADRGYPLPRSGGGYPIQLMGGGRVPPSQVWMGGTPSRWGTPHLGRGTPLPGKGVHPQQG